MSIKGKATIELTDVNTGEVEVIEENNLVTNGVKLFYERGLHHTPPILSPNIMRNPSQPAIYDLYGGIVVFSEALTEDPNNYDYPSCDTVATACIGKTNITAAKLGSYNSAESGAIENGYKFVYDFGTPQANGEIGSVCLIPLVAGLMTYGQSPSEYVGWTTDNISIEMSNYTGINSNRSPVPSYNGGFTFLANSGVDMSLFFDDDYLYSVKLYNITYNSSNATKHISQTNELVIEKRFINTTMADLFDRPGGMIKCEETITIPLQGTFAATRYICQYVDDRLYLFSTAQVNADAALTIYVIDINTWSVIEVKEVLNETGEYWRAYSNNPSYFTRAMLPQSKLFVTTSGNHIILVDINTGVHTFVTTSDGVYTLYNQDQYSAGLSFTKRLVNVRLRINSNNNRDNFVIDIETGRMYKIGPTNTGSVSSYNVCCKKNLYNLTLLNAKVYTKDTKQDQSTFGFLPYILMTINNLSSKVIKTSDKTMKITYILYDDTVTT